MVMFQIHVSLPEGNVPDYTRTSVSKNSIVRRLEPLTKNEFSTQHTSATAMYTPGKEKVFICHVFSTLLIFFVTPGSCTSSIILHHYPRHSVLKAVRFDHFFSHVNPFRVVSCSSAALLHRHVNATCSNELGTTKGD